MHLLLFVEHLHYIFTSLKRRNTIMGSPFQDFYVLSRDNSCLCRPEVRKDYWESEMCIWPYELFLYLFTYYLFKWIRTGGQLAGFFDHGNELPDLKHGICL
jgi:hypothetical protein